MSILAAAHELHRRQVLRGADAAGAVVELARVGARHLDQVLRRLGRRRGRHDEDVGHVRDVDDGCEILDRVEAQLRVEMDVDRVRADRTHQQVVAVGLHARRELGADVAAGAAAVVDDDRLAQLLRDRLGDHARGGVDAAARRPGHHQLDRLVRVAAGARLGIRRGGDGEQGRHQAGMRFIHHVRVSGLVVEPMLFAAAGASNHN